MDGHNHLEEFDALTQVEDLRDALRRANERASKAQRKNEQLASAVKQGAFDAMLELGKIPAVPRPKIQTRAGSPEVAVWHMTDWQGAKVTPGYNVEVMRRRIMEYCDRAAKLTSIARADHPVREAVILFGGDMGEGLFQFPQQPFEIEMTIMGQFACIARLEVDVIRRALSIYDRVTVIQENGNHGRIGSKRATVPLDDNFDRMTYELAREILKQQPEDWARISWEDTEADVQHFTIGNYDALLLHGDEVGRNGFASRNTFSNHVGKWAAGALGALSVHHHGDACERPVTSFRDAYVGHYHTHMEDPLPNGYGTLYWTGSPESDSRYANIAVAAGSVASQRLHFVSPEHGSVTAQYRVWLP